MLLEAYNIKEVLPSEPKPAGVLQLLKYVENVRDASIITPKSSKIASDYNAVKNYSEKAPFLKLCGLLTYQFKADENQTEGEDLIFIGTEDLWQDCVSRPQSNNPLLLEQLSKKSWNSIKT